MLFMGTLFAPVEDRDHKGQGFTHKLGDVVTIANPELGSLTKHRAPVDGMQALDLRRPRADGQSRQTRTALSLSRELSLHRLDIAAVDRLIGLEIEDGAAGAILGDEIDERRGRCDPTVERIDQPFEIGAVRVDQALLVAALGDASGIAVIGQDAADRP